MELIIERGRDHEECLARVRDTHGADCMIVHSYKRPDHYFIIVAIENTGPCHGHQLVQSVIRNSDASEEPGKGGGQAAIIDATSVPSIAREQSEAEISAEVLDLARQLKVLTSEPNSTQQETADVTQLEFEALNFSDVLSEVVSEVSLNKDANLSSLRNYSSNDGSLTATNGRVFKNIANKNVNRARISNSAIQFSALLSECISNDIHSSCSRAL